MKNMLISGAIVTSLAACSSSATEPAPAKVTQLKPQSGFLASGDPVIRQSNDGTKIVIEADGEVYVITPSKDVDSGSFDTGIQANSTSYQLASVSDGPNSVAGVANYTTIEGGAPRFIVAAGFGTKQAFDKPTSGRATAKGDYVGLLTVPGTDVPAEGLMVTGDATLFANFDANKISGRITNRTIGTAHNVGAAASFFDDSAVANVVLRETSINGGGRFYGTTSGGAITALGDSLSTRGSEAGRYSGLIASKNGKEIVGGLEFDAKYNNADGPFTLRETGVFATGH